MNIKKILKKNNGFTLVELIVAAIIILIGVTAVVVVVRKSTDMQVSDNYRRQARSAIMRMFETQFPRIVTQPLEDGTLAYTVSQDGWNTTLDIPVVSAGDANANNFSNPIPIHINKESTLDPITATMSFRAVSLTESMSLNGVSKEIDIHDITIKVVWQDAEGQDSVMLTKRLAATDGGN